MTEQEIVEKCRRLKRPTPWNRAFASMRQRCDDPSIPAYCYYGARGIRVRISPYQLKKLYLRDKAYKMKKPSVDHINPTGHYEPKNVRWIEVSENSRRMVEARSRDSFTPIRYYRNREGRLCGAFTVSVEAHIARALRKEFNAGGRVHGTFQRILETWLERIKTNDRAF